MRAGAGAITVALALAATGCATAETARLPLQAVQRVSVRLSGAVPGEATYTAVTSGISCSALAREGSGPGGAAPEGVPPPTEDTLIQGHPFNIVAVPSPYSGPGGYGPASFGASSVVMVDSHAWSPVAGKSSQTVATFGADGSGSVRFSGWRDALSGSLESGVLTWTCHA